MNQDPVIPIIQSIADAEDVEPSELDVQLYREISTDALRELVGHESDSWRVKFETVNYNIEVTGNGEILVDGVSMKTIN